MTIQKNTKSAEKRKDKDTNDNDEDVDNNDEDVTRGGLAEEVDLFESLHNAALKNNPSISSDAVTNAMRSFMTQISPVSKKQSERTFDDVNAIRTLDFDKDTNNDDVALETMLSPKMKKLIQRDQLNYSAKTEYSFYGLLAFVDNQAVFDTTFGNHPTMLQITRLSQTNSNAGTNSITNTSTAIKKLPNYIDKCHFDIFVAICKADYIGISDPVSEQRATQEICKKITKLHQITQQKQTGNKRIVLHPAQLFQEFLILIPSLPDDATTWSIILCRTFYDVLTQDLRDKLDDDDFILPDMTSLTTKQS